MLRAVHRKDPEEKSLLETAAYEPPEAPAPASREICLSADIGFESVPVFQRSSLPVGFEITGPAIIEQPDTTTLIYRDHQARVDQFENLIIDLPETG